MLNAICEKNDSELTFHKKRVSLLLRLNKLEEAEKAWEVESVRFPQAKFEVQLDKVHILISMEKPSSTLELLKTMEPSSKTQLELICYYKGLCHGQLGNTSEVIEVLKDIGPESNYWQAKLIMMAAAFVLMR